MTVANELLTLQKRSGGILKVEDAEKWARANPRSCLHSELEWDDKKAGQEYRFWQIRRLIKLNITNEQGAPQLVSLSIDRVKAGGGYRDLETVMSSPPLREVLLTDALADLERVRLKYEGFRELARVWEEVRKVGREVKRKAA